VFVPDVLSTDAPGLTAPGTRSPLVTGPQ
jgi:hypothetical protein